MLRSLVLSTLVLAGCQAEIPDGRLLCATASSDCPAGFVCCPASVSGDFDGLCHRGDSCADRDGGTADAGSRDGGGFDAGLDDAGRDDAGSVDAGPDGGADGGVGPQPLDVTVGAAHSCLLSSDGALHCWGDNNDGQLGTGSVSSTRTTAPIEVATSLSGVLAIDAASDATCARTSSEIHCWGSGAGPSGFGVGVLGQTGVTQSPTPIEVLLTHGPPHAFDMGGWFGCAIVGADRHLECWGDNDYGQLGIGGTIDQEEPRDVPGLTGVADVCAGWGHVCAALDDGRMFCWGSNLYGQLGTGTSGSTEPVDGPVEITALTAVRRVVCGAEHTCAVAGAEGSGTLHCWGDNPTGETGQDWASVNPVETPTAVGFAALDEPTVLLAGGRFNLVGENAGITCAASATSPLRCFGSNSNGFLGSGAWTPLRSFMPVAVSGLRMDVVDAAAQSYHACAIDEDASGVRRVLCWGAGGRGQLGNSDSEASNAPVIVTGFGGGS